MMMRTPLLALLLLIGCGNYHASDGSSGGLAAPACVPSVGGVYVLGRNAYESGRESGDFTEALRLARQLDASGDKNGDRLLKMVYLQLGWGGHTDYVQAYVWLSEAMAGR